METSAIVIIILAAFNLLFFIMLGNFLVKLGGVVNETRNLISEIHERVFSQPAKRAVPRPEAGLIEINSPPVTYGDPRLLEKS